jgi:hypothetical protein
MEMRDEDRVDVVQPVGRRHWLDPSEMPDPAAGDRIRQDADAVELDEDRRVPQELEAQRPAQRQPLRAASG